MYNNNFLDQSDNNLSLSKSYNVSFHNEDEYGESENIQHSSKLQSKIILIGDQAVGKTSIFHRFMEETFSDTYKCTVGVEYKIKSLLIDNTTKMELKIWDTCGQEQFRSLTKSFFRESNGAILVFDLTNRTTFEHLNDWVKDLENNAPPDIQVFVAGNKADLENERIVTSEGGEKFKEAYELDMFMETSAKTGYNAELLFIKAAVLLYNEHNKYLRKVNISFYIIFLLEK